MNRYLADTEFAVRSLFELVTRELQQIQLLKKQMEHWQEKANDLHREAYYITDQDIDDLETPGMYMNRNGFGRIMSTVNSYQKNIEEAEMSYLAKEYSIRALCGAILQIAKQGISIVHSGIWSNTPEIRDPVSGLSIAEIIWEGRNQSLHYEDKRPPFPSVKRVFEVLVQCYGNLFDLSAKRNLAFEVVINVLGWTRYEDYEATMSKILL